MGGHRMLHRLLITALAALLALPATARENHALLIGASTYQNLDERWWLRGPSNDVELVATYLRQDAPVPFEDANITVLADGVAGSTPPTLAAIRAAFSDLTARVGEGDFVYLHFSGHGSQAPAADPDSELDGLDELFLPVDIGEWSDGIGAVENALVDDEIGAMIDGLKARGAQVWAVFDSCHSGTVTRAVGGGDIRLRKLPSEALGISQDAIDNARVSSRGVPNPRANPDAPFDGGGGSLVAFFAAQTNETTPEKNMPPGEDHRRLQGVFTYTLFETLAENPSLTYQQLGQEILRKYSALNLARSTPLFEGDLRRPVFASGNVSEIRQWPAEVEGDSVSIRAGRLHGLAEGEVIAMMASPIDTDEAALGFYKVASVEGFRSDLVPTDHEGRALVAPGDLPRGVHARKINSTLNFGLTVALPDPKDPHYVPVKLALEAITEIGDPLGGRVKIVPSDQDADIRISHVRHGGRPNNVWLFPASGVVERADLKNIPSIRVAGKAMIDLEADFEDSFQRISKALNLIRVGGSALSGGSAVEAEVAVLTRNKDDRTLRRLDFTTIPKLIAGDEVHIHAHNPTGEPVDVNLLHVGVTYEITHFVKQRLQPGDKLKLVAFSVDDKGFGRDRLIAVLTPARPQSLVEDLSFLQQKALPRTRALGGSRLNSLLADAGFGTADGGLSRSFKLLSGPDTGPGPRIMNFAIDTFPAE